MNDPAATWEDITTLTPWEKNPRHNAHAVDQVRDSIVRFGFSSPIIARTADRVVIAGHTRLLAAQKLGMDKVPVRFMDLDPDQAAALALADNKLGELAEWDDQALADILGELQDNNVDIASLGWSASELEALIEVPDFDPDDEGADLPAKEYQCPHCGGQLTMRDLEESS